MYSYRHTANCLCAECVRGDDKRLDRKLDASIQRLSDSLLTPEPEPEVTSLGELNRAAGKAPWEMSATEFAASAALRVVPAWGAPGERQDRARRPPERALGLKRSYLRNGMELRLDVEWAPPGGYVVLVSDDEDSDPRRAFVKMALGKGIVVAAEILAAYPDLSA